MAQVQPEASETKLERKCVSALVPHVLQVYSRQKFTFRHKQINVMFTEITQIPFVIGSKLQNHIHIYSLFSLKAVPQCTASPFDNYLRRLCDVLRLNCLYPLCSVETPTMTFQQHKLRATA